MARASKDPEVKELAKKAGAKGINVAGICCTANEIMMRHGLPIAGNFLCQELALLTAPLLVAALGGHAVGWRVVR